ncbi:MAG: hypothetical protein HZB81_08220 [Deltaproteobacteria bacterium]|nr:hypothetical protein [Deltaproteobacteria bacterium]
MSPLPLLLVPKLQLGNVDVSEAPASKFRSWSFNSNCVPKQSLGTSIKLTDTDIESAISGGGASVSKSTLMPSFGKTLTNAEIKDLTAYLRKLCKCKGK